MHIKLSPADKFCDGQTREYLQQFVAQPGPQHEPPCPGCSQPDSRKCSPYCTEAPRALSIEPDLYPIEEKVVPVVYEMTATRLLKTCWSCQGHVDMDNELWKVPQVCFYTEAPVYSKLVALHLRRLFMQKRLHYPWHIALSDFGQPLGLLYSIQSDLSHVREAKLDFLQQDLAVIAADMGNSLKAIAAELLNTYCSN